MTTHPAMRASTLSWALGALILLGAQFAHAAAAPVSTTPTRFAALIHAPRVVSLRFNEAIVRKSSGVSLTDLAGHPVRLIPLNGHGDSSMEARIAAKLGAGVYMVHWKAVSAIDGSRTSGSYQFTVQ
ncbi:MAG TPA: copper resistance CopC family protein [Steroidobacteraceae bacterium]|nr:copper resistance CopC family protein [Steroidobacteraceae bacterium]